MALFIPDNTGRQSAKALGVSTEAYRYIACGSMQSNAINPDFAINRKSPGKYKFV